MSDSEEIRNFPSTEQISEALHENGFIKVEGCFSRKFVEAIKADVEAHRFYLNRNGLTGVYSEHSTISSTFSLRRAPLYRLLPARSSKTH